MAKKHKTKARGWHNPAKFVLHGTHGKCKLCKKLVKNLEEHMKKMHKKEIKRIAVK